MIEEYLQENRTPEAIEAESSVLGAMMISPRAAEQCRQMLKASHFKRPAHAILFSAFCELLDSGMPIDVVTVETLLRDRKQLKDIGGPDYLLEISMFVPSSANSEFYARIVIEKAVQRSDIEAGKKLARMAMDGASPEERRAFKSSLMAESEAGTLRAPVRPVWEYDPARDASGLTTGFPKLDRMSWRGGFASGQVSVVVAGTGKGKSTWMMSSAFRLLAQGKRVLYATFADLDGGEIHYRLIRSMVGFGSPRTLEQQAQWDQARNDIEFSRDLDIYDACQLETGDTEIESFGAWFMASHEKKPYDIAFLDYAQEIQSRSPKATNEFSEQHIVGRTCRVLAAKAGIPIVVGSQVTEGADGSMRTRNSKVWENIAAWILAVKEDGMRIQKGRFGARDTTAQHRFDPERAVFTDQGLE